MIAAVAAQSSPPPGGIPGKYVTLCAGCHGATLAGGTAPSLLDDEWAHGGSDDDLARSIRDGWPTSGMPAFRQALNDAEIRAMVIYLREMRERGRLGGLPTQPPPIPDVIRSEEHTFRVETVVEGLDTPWGFEFLPDGRLIVTERPGRLRIVGKDGTLQPPLTGLPPIWVRQDGGLMDVALHPDYARNGWIYLAFSEMGGSVPNASTTRIIRARIRDGALVDQQTIFQAPAELYWEDNTHYGARFLFDAQGRLFYSVGDRGRTDTAQDPASPYGKLHRVLDDGGVPEDNPFVKKPGALKTVWSYGHRNQQGLAIHPVTGDLWATEHGPRGGDELNVILAGRNYGWPLVTHGMNYDGTPVTDRTEQEGMEGPVVQWTPSTGVCGIAFYTGDRFPKWKNNLFVTGLVGQELRRIVIDGRRVTHQEVLFRGYGRVRDVVNGPDGYLYVAFNAPGKIVRLVPEA